MAAEIQTFEAPNMAEAMRKVKTAMGPDAMILRTRTVCRRRWLGLWRQQVVQITAARGIEVPAQPAASRSSAAGRRAQAHPTAARQGAPSPAAILNTPAANTALMVGICRDMEQLKSMVNDLVRQHRAEHAPEVPQEVFDYYMQLIQNEVAAELAVEIVRNLRSQVRPEHLRNEAFVREKLAEQIEKMVPVAGPITRRRSSGPHVVALVGPTGVGKTTTIAKLAANMKLREHRKVGLITMDTYRIAAADQLKKYADIIGAPLRIAASPEDLRDAVAGMKECDFVLIDTAGRSPSDSMRLNELRTFLEAARPDEVHLVLAATASQECLEAAIARFGEVGVDRIIFTKLDEAVHIGVMLNVIRMVNKALSYVTTGQDVPDDIEVGQGRKLARLIIGGKS